MSEHGLPDDPPPWRTLASREVYANAWMRVRHDDVVRPDGSTGIYGVARLGRAAGVLPFVDRDHVLLVRQRRYITGEVTWEMPTGGVDDGEDPMVAAQRELIEETGHRAGRLRHVSTHVTSKSVVDEWAYLYVADDLAPAVADATDETEVISAHRVPFDQVVTWVLDGTIVDAMTVIAVLLVERERRLG